MTESGHLHDNELVVMGKSLCSYGKFHADLLIVVEFTH